jgi:uncharacterized membrane protein (DUF2068 family)
VDWNRRYCARHGHITYRPDEPDLAERLHVETPVGEAWRCLRCGDFALGEPTAAGPAEEAPVVWRGRALRDRAILRVLAVERGIRGVLVLLVAYAIYRFADSQASLRQLFERDLPAAKPLADRFGYDLDNSPVLLGYAAIELAEAIGLWRLRRWAEYLTVVATAIFLPLEIYELVEKVTYLRVIAFLFNLAVVVYLLLAKRLFGLRGGHAAVERERHGDSILEVERAATMADAVHHAPARAPRTPTG